MSLRARVLSLVGLVLLLAVAGYSALALQSARTTLAQELDAARRNGLQTIRSAFEDLPRSNHPDRDLRQLIATFDGNRHLRASSIDKTGNVLFRSHPAIPLRPAPHWFSVLVSPDLAPSFLFSPVSEGVVVRLEPDPASDVSALWSALSRAVAILLAAATVGLVLVYAVIGRALAPLGALARGLEAIAGGGYDARIARHGPPELAPLQQGFNAMAARLQEADNRNRALETQLLSIQDEERAEIARDLHDEIGPYLFAVSLDAEMISRAAKDGGGPTSDQVRSIKAAVSHMQHHVRDLIARLRPTPATELGLSLALRDLLAFWQARQPDVAFESRIEATDADVPGPLKDIIYRLVQEATANALRHAETTRVAVSLVHETGTWHAEVENAGRSKTASASSDGLGLITMRERVQAAGGCLSIIRGDQGWTVRASFTPMLAERANAGR